MGTNYYAEVNKCNHCHRCDKIHLGKYSQGWRFIVEAHNEHYNDYKSFVEFIKRKDITIVDEYGDVDSPGELLLLIDGAAREGKPHTLGTGYKQWRDGPLDFTTGEFS